MAFDTVSYPILESGEYYPLSADTLYLDEERNFSAISGGRNRKRVERLAAKKRHRGRDCADALGRRWWKDVRDLPLVIAARKVAMEECLQTLAEEHEMRAEEARIRAAKQAAHQAEEDAY